MSSGRGGKLRRRVQPLVAGDCHRDPCGSVRAQILYWAYLGFVLPDKLLPQAQQQASLKEMIRMASR